MNKIQHELPLLLLNIWTDPASQGRLTELLHEVHPGLRWEAGPLRDDLMYLAVSPNYHPELLPITENLILSLPKLPNWQYFSAKPRKDWISRKVNYQEIDYCFDQWRYRLTMFKGGEFFDIDFFGCDEGLPEDVRDWLSVFLASSELGERLFMEAVDRVSASPFSSQQGPTSAIDSLFDQVSELFHGRDGGMKS